MNKQTKPDWWLVAALVMLCLILAREARADGVDVERLANAIYKAEGGAKTRHPYGILAKYKHTTPRQACINTIKHKYTDYLRLKANGEAIGLDFLGYLSTKYAPLGASNDPTGLNANWLANVRYFYGQ